MHQLSRAFQFCLWNSRYIVILAVFASLIVSLVLFSVVTIDTARLIADIYHYSDPSLNSLVRATMRIKIITHVAAVVDGYLFGTIMIIFAIGLYELFIGKLEVIENSELASRLLLIRSLDDLKNRLAKVIFLILVVLYFEKALEANVSTMLDLLYLAVGVFLIGAALYLTTRGEH